MLDVDARGIIAEGPPAALVAAAGGPEGRRIFDTTDRPVMMAAEPSTPHDMKTKISPAVVGAFVLGAFAIGIITLLALGSLSLFTKPERFIVYFDESISGLDQGSPVKLRGVRVGHVVGISIRYDRATGKSLAAVLCELNRGSITDEHGASFDVSDRAALQALVDRGLRAQLEIGGLATGLLFVELDFLDPHKYPDLSKAADEKYVVVPPAPSEISELRAQRRHHAGERHDGPRQDAAGRLPGALGRDHPARRPRPGSGSRALTSRAWPSSGRGPGSRSTPWPARPTPSTRWRT